MWIDLDDAYWTMNTEYIESVWWSLKQLHARGPAGGGGQGHGLLPALRHRAVRRRGRHGLPDRRGPQRLPAVPAGGGRRPLARGRRRCVVWTTTPWTLPSNDGRGGGGRRRDVRTWWRAAGSASSWARRCGSACWARAARSWRPLTGADLVGARYDPPYPNVEGAHIVVGAGTSSRWRTAPGIVHMAPAFGPEDLAIGPGAGMADLQAGRRRRPVHRPGPGVRPRACS